MRVYTLLELTVSILAFAAFFFMIEPLLMNNLVLKFLVFSLIWFALTYINKKVGGRFKFLDKRMDKYISGWLVISLLVVFYVVGFYF